MAFSLILELLMDIDKLTLSIEFILMDIDKLTHQISKFKVIIAEINRFVNS